MDSVTGLATKVCWIDFEEESGQKKLNRLERVWKTKSEEEKDA